MITLASTVIVSAVLFAILAVVDRREYGVVYQCAMCETGVRWTPERRFVHTSGQRMAVGRNGMPHPPLPSAYL